MDTTVGAGPATMTKGSLAGGPAQPARQNPPPSKPLGVEVGDFVQQQPMTAALIALVVGYFIGKLT
jgi:hypothetical protein